jgi:hypothetical protein
MVLIKEMFQHSFNIATKKFPIKNYAIISSYIGVSAGIIGYYSYESYKNGNVKFVKK